MSRSEPKEKTHGAKPPAQEVDRSASKFPLVQNFLVFLFFSILSLLLTWPAALHLSNRVIGGYAGDNFHFLWELWYVAHAVFDLHKSPFFDPDIYVPFGFDLIKNQDLSPATVLLFMPLTRLIGELATYNILIIASFALTAFGTYLLAKDFWGNQAGALVAGLGAGFCAYRFTHAGGHLSIVSTQWIPFFFLYLERTIRKPSAFNGACTGLFYALCALSTWYYAWAVPIAVVFYLAVRVRWWSARSHLWPLLKASSLAAALALFFILPFAIPYVKATSSGAMAPRSLYESQAFASSITDFVIPSIRHPLWGRWVLQHWRSGPNGQWLSEWELYLGIPLALLALIGIFTSSNRRLVASLLTLGIACFILSLGPSLYLWHPPTRPDAVNQMPLSAFSLPVMVLNRYPPFSFLRAWSRMGYFLQLTVALLAAAGLAFLLSKIPERRRPLRAIVACAAFGLVLVDGLAIPCRETPVVARPVDRWLAALPGKFPIMEFPIPNHGYSGPAMYSTRLTGKQIIMGYASYPPNLAFWETLSAFPSPSTLDVLYDWGAKYVLVDENLYRAGSSFWNVYQTWNTLESAIKESPRLKEVTALNGVHVYQLGSGSHDDAQELLTNGSFEQGSATFLPGWKIVGKPKVDRTSKYSVGGRAACAMTAKDVLLSEPVPVEPGQCYRLSVRERANSSKLGTVRLQIDWKREDKNDVDARASAIADARSARGWQESTLIAQAPTGTKYAIVRAAAAGGNIWVDEFSLKKIPADCEPVLFVTPDPVAVPAGQIGRAAVSWNTCCTSEGRVILRVDDGPDQVVANGQSGLTFLDGIKRGSQYQFQLYVAQQNIPAQTTTVTTREGTDTIVADPNPVPADSGLNRTRISWATLTEGDAEVCVSQNGGPELLFARGATGSVQAPWITSGSSYEFRLYTGQRPRRLLAKVVVTTVNPNAHNAVH